MPSIASRHIGAGRMSRESADTRPCRLQVSSAAPATRYSTSASVASVAFGETNSRNGRPVGRQQTLPLSDSSFQAAVHLPQRLRRRIKSAYAPSMATWQDPLWHGPHETGLPVDPTGPCMLQRGPSLSAFGPALHRFLDFRQKRIEVEGLGEADAGAAVLDALFALG